MRRMLDSIAARAQDLSSAAPYWTLRAVEEVTRTLTVRQDVVQPPHTSVDRGVMLSAYVEGGYGYAATSDFSTRGLQAALDRATGWALACRGASLIGSQCAPQFASANEPPSTTTPDWPLRALHAALAQECAAAAIDARVVERMIALELRTQHVLLLSSAGQRIEQAFHSTVPMAQVTANAGGDTQSRSYEFAQQGGLENLERSAFVGCGASLAREALELLAAPNCPNEQMDLLLMPDQMMLQIHESIGHPLELDRILGDERNYAGTSFVTLDMLGSYRYGSELLNITFDPTVAGEIASYTFDDDGSPAAKAFLIRAGILERALGGSTSQWRARQPGTANARASTWNRPPIDRMANLNIEPGASTLAQMIAGIERGALMRTNRSWSIDDARNKFQFGCEWGQLIENGALTTVVKNPNYRGVSANFWRSLKLVGDRGTYEVHGTLYCGKGEPNQAIHVGHAAPACAFSSVDVFGGA